MKIKTGNKIQVNGFVYTVLVIKDSSKLQDGRTVNATNVVTWNNRGERVVFEMAELERKGVVVL